MRYEPVIGLEVHAQIHTRSKMFCGCPVVEDTGDLPPNTSVCPVCAALPGVLPVVNRHAVEIAIKTGLALHCNIPPVNRFARKSYFYPDLPKGYQISQYALPLAVDGYVEIDSNGAEKRVRVQRAHLEEDAGKLYHQGGISKVDLNRAGIPLLEIVSEPDMRSADEARAYGEALREILVYLGVNSGNMERGVMRFEANVSVRPIESERLGARHEIKNLNSFRALYESIAHEIQDQISVLERGGKIEPQTMGWNEVQGVTVPQRGKEFAHDYRYFPEPDIPPLEISREMVDSLRTELPELPKARRARFAAQYDLSEYDATLLVEDKGVADYFERAVEAAVSAKEAANWITGELFRLMKMANRDIEGIDISAEALAELIELVEEGRITQSTGKEVLTEMFTTGHRACDIVREQGLAQISDAQKLREIVARTLEENPEQVEEYLMGKKQVLGWFIGQVMQATQGKANPQLARELLTEKLETIHST
ncbi:MAG: Asp-tRNA(Asn)/Glu-tRNA(Gln) amidotransferase subunit GatB [Chloroflexota bacterium]|nr:Asp-tRNA(Asn)/Glu-tRNA(Gln) amidotransferase subunit GatB [Chloroflexota bacterium]